MAIESIEINPELPQVHICWFPGITELPTPEEAAMCAVEKDKHAIVRVRMLGMFSTHWYEVVGCKWSRKLGQTR